MINRAAAFLGVKELADLAVDFILLAPHDTLVAVGGLEELLLRRLERQVEMLGDPLGKVTSGTLSPTLNYPVAMAYVAAEKASVGQNFFSEVRGKRQPMRLTTMPFVPHRYHRV